MQCHEFEARWNDLLDERRPPDRDPQLQRHAARCPACRELLAAQQVVFPAVEQASSTSLRPDFAARVVVAATHLPGAVPRRRLPRLLGKRTVAALSAAAAIAVALSLAWQWRAPSGPAANSTARTARGTGRLTGSARMLSTIQPGPVGRKSSEVSPARKARPAVASVPPAAAPLPPDEMQPYRVALDELTLAWPDAATRLDEIERLAPGLRPLRESLAAIWETLRRAVTSISAESAGHEPRDTGFWRLEAARVV